MGNVSRSFHPGKRIKLSNVGSLIVWLTRSFWRLPRMESAMSSVPWTSPQHTVYILYYINIILGNNNSVPSQSFFFYLAFFSFFFICSEFCHTLKWNSHGFTCVPHPDPPTPFPVFNQKSIYYHHHLKLS